MSSREPLWYCHECHAEMRPLMVPDPVCASCRGSFVEKIENPQDDPRQFTNVDEPTQGMPPGIDTFLLTLQSLMDRGMAQAPNQPPRTETRGQRVTFELRGGNGSRVVSFGGPNTLNQGEMPPSGSGTGVPTMSEFLRGAPNTGRNGATIDGRLMAQYLMALLGQQDHMAGFFPGGMGGGIPENGRMGDYVFNQEALDQIITQIMENSNTNRPVPATEEIIKNLPREVLIEGSETLEKDCAVCKEQFKLETEDPDEQVVVTLPCHHPFHEPCILPWLKSSGTCPVCRHQLVPQPEHHPPPPPPGPGQDSGPPQQDHEHDHGHSLFHAIFNGLTGGQSGNSPRGNQSGNSSQGGTEGRDTTQQSSSTNSSSSPPSRPSNSENHLPGGWTEDLD